MSNPTDYAVMLEESRTFYQFLNSLHYNAWYALNKFVTTIPHQHIIPYTLHVTGSGTQFMFITYLIHFKILSDTYESFK